MKSKGVNSNLLYNHFHARRALSYDPKHAKHHHYKWKGHKTLFIVNLRSKETFKFWICPALATKYLCESLFLFVPFHKQQYWWWWWCWWWCVSVWRSQCVCTVSPAQLVSSRTLYMFLPSHLHSLAVRKNFILRSPLIFSWKRSQSLNFHFCRVWQVRVSRMTIYTCKYKRDQITFVGNLLFVQRNSLRLKVSWSPYPKVPRSSDSLTANF